MIEIKIKGSDNMIYFKVKKDFRVNKQRRKKVKSLLFVKDEIFTKKEFEKYLKSYDKKINYLGRNVQFEDNFEKTQIPKNRTYHFFGARFETSES